MKEYEPYVAYLTTREVCDLLQVSRSWVNTHLRQLGTEPFLYSDDDSGRKTPKRIVGYKRADILRWVNENATFSRQTQLLDLSDYATEESLQAWEKNLIANRRSLELPEIYFGFLERILPSEYMEQHRKINERCRGLLPWQPVQASVKDFSDMKTIDYLREDKSEEMAYRDIYLRGMLRVELFGRRWYMRVDEAPMYSITMPYGYDRG